MTFYRKYYGITELTNITRIDEYEFSIFYEKTDNNTYLSELIKDNHIINEFITQTENDYYLVENTVADEYLMENTENTENIEEDHINYSDDPEVTPAFQSYRIIISKENSWTHYIDAYGFEPHKWHVVGVIEWTDNDLHNNDLLYLLNNTKSCNPPFIEYSNTENNDYLYSNPFEPIYISENILPTIDMLPFIIKKRVPIIYDYIIPHIEKWNNDNIKNFDMEYIINQDENMHVPLSILYHLLHPITIHSVNVKNLFDRYSQNIKNLYSMDSMDLQMLYSYGKHKIFDIKEEDLELINDLYGCAIKMQEIYIGFISENKYDI